MGFNATRKYRDSKWRDVTLLIVGILVIGACVAWAGGVL